MPACLPPVLVFAASDPSCGAGLQADLLTLAALGCQPLTALSAITVQDSRGVSAVQPVAPDLLVRQAAALLADMPVAAFKVGVLATADNIHALADLAAAHPQVPLVLDPVLASGRGDALTDEKARAALCQALLPRATVITPNTLEARRLAGNALPADAPLAEVAAWLMARGARHVLLTGSHEATPEVEHVLWGAEGVLHRGVWPRLPGEYHGSGCTLASAIAAGLAHGRPLVEAVAAAEAYTWQSLAAATRPGHGQHFPDRLFRLRRLPEIDL